MSGSLSAFFHHPAIVAVALALAIPLLYVLWRELRTIPAKLHVLMATAFLDMIGVLIIVPILPFYAKTLAADGVNVRVFGGSIHLGIGAIVATLVAGFTVAQLLSAPLWGRFSDRYGRRPALIVALVASAVAYLIFGYADSLVWLLVSRIVQGAGGGTVGVIQAYVADATEPSQRARSLGWLSAATNAGVALGPVLGSLAVTAGHHNFEIGGSAFSIGRAAPGLLAAVMCLVASVFAWRYLPESRAAHSGEHARTPRSTRPVMVRVLTHGGDPSSRLIWIYAIAMGAFMAANSVLALFLAVRHGVTAETIGIFFTYIGVISVLTRVLLLGRAVDRLGEARLSRIGTVLLALGLAGIPLAPNVYWLALPVAFIPLGTAFTFPCVTSLLSRVIPNHERGLYMGVQQTFGGVTRVVFPYLAGVAYDTLGHGVPFFVAASLVVATLILGLGMEGYTRSRPEAVAV